MEKQEFIIAEQKRKLAEMEAALEAATLKLEDTEAIAAEDANAAYEKAVEVVTETVQAETVKSDIAIVEDYKEWVTAPDRGVPEKQRGIITKVLDAVKNRIARAAAKVLEKVRVRLQEPTVREAGINEIRKTAKESLFNKLKEYREIQQNENAGTASPDRKKKQDMEH